MRRCDRDTQGGFPPIVGNGGPCEKLGVRVGNIPPGLSILEYIQLINKVIFYGMRIAADNLSRGVP